MTLTQAAIAKAKIIDFKLIDEGEAVSVFSGFAGNFSVIREYLAQFEEARRPVRVTEWDGRPKSSFGMILALGEKSVTLHDGHSEFEMLFSQIDVIEDYKRFRIDGIRRSGFGE